jgi:ABC-type lipopolysaccharide export system ATPase subunit
LENIALIQEVHLKKSASETEANILELLKKISLERIANQRIPTCNEFELFCAMLIRALQSQKKRLFIVTPFSLISSLVAISEITDVIEKLDSKKDIIILDLQNNRSNYEGALCHIVK